MKRTIMFLVLLCGPSLLLFGGLYLSPLSTYGKDLQTRMERYERERGAKSGLTILARVDSQMFPALSDSDQKLLTEATRAPFSFEEERRASLRAISELYEPWYQIWREAAQLPGSFSFPYRSSGDPMPDWGRLQAVGRSLAVRAQMRAQDGELDKAINDLLLVWKIGASFESAENGILIHASHGVHLRLLALGNLLPLVERFDLPAPSADQIVRELTIIKPPLLLEHLGNEVQWKLEILSPRLPREAARNEALARQLQERIAALDLADYATMEKALAEIEAQQESLDEQLPTLKKFGKQARQIARKNAIAKAQENLLLTLLFALEANRRCACAASDDMIREVAGEHRVRLIDPFTGAPLRVMNHGGNAVAVFSAGPDMVYSDTAFEKYSHGESGSAEPGDIFVKTRAFDGGIKR